MNDHVFKKIVQSYYSAHGRHTLPWRINTSEYAVVVSEVMLQQTQVGRVIPAFESWLQHFPDWATLANAQLSEVLGEWQGLGYNRRGKYLHDIAQIVYHAWGGRLERTPPKLAALPGVGPNTAAAVLVYAHNQPEVFIETNIRSVFIHHYFGANDRVSDKEVAHLVDATLDRSNPREWYWALMDYGAHIKKEHKNPSRKSTHYVRQSRFEGSTRQLRSLILKRVLAGAVTRDELFKEFSDTYRVNAAIESMVKDGLLARAGETIRVV